MGWHDGLAQNIHLPPDAVLIGGSAAAGVSLSPMKRLRPFGLHSDIDLVVVSEGHFEQAWGWMRVAHRSTILTPIQRDLIRDHMTRLVFFETIACDRCRNSRSDETGLPRSKRRGATR
jgi:hypothetical protein